MNIKKLVAVILFATTVGYSTYAAMEWYEDTYKFNVFGCESTPGELTLGFVLSAEAADGGFYVTSTDGVRVFHRPSAYYNCMLLQKD